MPHQTAQPIPENSVVDADAAAALTKLLTNPSMAELIKNLAKNLYAPIHKQRQLSNWENCCCFIFFASCTSASDMIHFYRKEWSA